MALFNGLLDEYRALISALEAVDSEESDLKWEHVESRVLQEEQRILIRVKSAQQKAEAAALLSIQNSHPTALSRSSRPSRNRSYCNFCKGPGHYKNKCWMKFPHLNPGTRRDPLKNPFFFATQSNEGPAICLMASHSHSLLYSLKC